MATAQARSNDRLGKAAIRAGAMAFVCLAAPAWAQGAPMDAPRGEFIDPQAIECLATAISYEAGNEPAAGQEAVAQVVLNRVRAPDFPKTVCGVVYQGSTRRTGCQFTFTCDGSLLRPRTARSMSAARLVAERVLRGEGTALVGDALNYHADYVSPGWARSLDRVIKIGAHIFYRRPEGDVPGGVVGAGDAAFVGAGAAVPARRGVAGGVFAPWGLPVLAVARGGKARALAVPLIAPEHQIGPFVDPGHRDGQAALRAGATAVDARLGNDGNGVIDQTIAIADRR